MDPAEATRLRSYEKPVCNMASQSTNDIRSVFEREFGPMASKFGYFDIGSDDWRNGDLIEAARPGVYVWYDWERDRVIKVGLSMINARARALQHLRDDTGGTMAAMRDQAGTRLILFTLPEEDKHWAAALEPYLERVLEPEIPSKR